LPIAVLRLAWIVGGHFSYLTDAEHPAQNSSQILVVGVNVHVVRLAVGPIWTFGRKESRVAEDVRRLGQKQKDREFEQSQAHVVELRANLFLSVVLEDALLVELVQQ